MSQTITREKMLSAKELASEIQAQYGITVSPRYVRSMLRAGVRRVGYNARLSDVMAWWEANPDFQPRATADR